MVRYVPLLMGILAATPALAEPLSPPPLRWPLLEQDWNQTFHYVDLDPGPGILDWSCADVAYDTHRGNDMTIRDFLEMDEGRFVVAAAEGTVAWVEDGYYDRSTEPNGAPPNYVDVLHADGSHAYYMHLRKWSTLVAAGQHVYEGQPLGLVGSSGNSSNPHLHFEVGDGVGNTLEPYAGPCRGGASLWKAPQPPHGSAASMELADSGVHVWQPWYWFITQPPPDMTHVQQSAANALFFWVKFRNAHPGDVSRATFYDPGNAVYLDSTHTHTSYQAWDWLYFTVFMPTSGSLGTWRAEYRLNGVLQVAHSFVFDGAAYASPTAVGRTVAVPRAVAVGPLRASDPDGGLRAFQLAGPPPAHGEVVLSGPRASTFTYVPESGYVGQDSFQFQAEDAQGNWSAPATMILDVTAGMENVLRLEGEEDHVSVPTSASLSFPGPFTLEAWIRRTAGSNKYQQIFDLRNPVNLEPYGYNLFVDPGSRLVFALGTGTARWYMYSTRPVPLGRWTHVAVTWDGTHLHMYLDGIEEPVPFFFPGPVGYTGVADLKIGGGQTPFESFRGEIDEARAWSVARTPAQIAQGMTCAFFDAAVPALVRGLWRFNGNAADASSFGNAGTRIGGAGFVRTDSGVPLNCSGFDSDADGIPDAADRCPLTVGAGTQDGDGDGVGDDCDRCPAVKDRGQADSDGDGIGDLCDRCPFAGDSEQIDTDGDGAGDACDPAPADPAETPPGRAISLALSHSKVTGVTTIAWGTEPHAASYEVYRGTRDQLEARFYGTCQSARDPNPSDLSFAESEGPGPGEVHYYLVLGVSPGGARGLAGAGSDSQERDLRARDCR